MSDNGSNNATSQQKNIVAVFGPDELQAQQFAVMLQSGLPATDAIMYFVEIEDPKDLGPFVKKWQRSPLVRQALIRLTKKSFMDMTPDERMKYALELHYNQLAYVLVSQNYADAGSAEKSKADTARSAIEAKLAGTAGKTSAMDRFFDDLAAGKLKLAQPVRMLTAN